MTKIKKICVFCGARASVEQKYKDIATELGQLLVKYNKETIYGGSGLAGMMGSLSESIISAGGKITGIFPKNILNQFDALNTHLSKAIIVESLTERKVMMIYKSDAFIVLPGGFGTIDEFFEVLALKQIKVHKKPIFLVNRYGFWDPMIEMMNKLKDLEFCTQEHNQLYKIIDDNLDYIFNDG